MVPENERDAIRTTYMARHPDAVWDLLTNLKCSLLIAKDPEDRTDLIITLHGDAVTVPENERDAVRTTYMAHIIGGDRSSYSVKRFNAKPWWLGNPESCR